MRVHQPSLREPTVEPWSSHLCLVSPRLSTSWAWVNLSLASCLKKTTKKHLLSAFPSHNVTPTRRIHLILKEISRQVKSNDQSVGFFSFKFVVLNVEKKKFRREPLFAKLPVVAHQNSSRHAQLVLWK